VGGYPPRIAFLVMQGRHVAAARSDAVVRLVQFRERDEATPVCEANCQPSPQCFLSTTPNGRPGAARRTATPGVPVCSRCPKLRVLGLPARRLQEHPTCVRADARIPRHSGPARQRTGYGRSRPRSQLRAVR
jgi:hypothetical protein